MNPDSTLQPEIEVLLATYNGARFLRPQIESILNQTWQATRILARDDGSTDETPNLLAEYAERYPGRFRVIATDRSTGSAMLNFRSLLQHSNGRWVAFADQDDVWQPQKLALAATAMKTLEQTCGETTPLLLFSDLEVVNAELQSVHSSLWNYNGLIPADVHRLERLLLQNVVTGCTMLINRPLAETASQMPPSAMMHDHWIALLACLYGNSDFIAQPLVRYRQHHGNVIGARGPMTLQRVRRALSNEGRHKHWNLCVAQAAALLAATTAGGSLPRLTIDQEAKIKAFVECGRSQHRLTRITTLLRHDIRYSSLFRTLTLVWYVWSKQRAPRKS